MPKIINNFFLCGCCISPNKGKKINYISHKSYFLCFSYTLQNNQLFLISRKKNWRENEKIILKAHFLFIYQKNLPLQHFLLNIMQIIIIYLYVKISKTCYCLSYYYKFMEKFLPVMGRGKFGSGQHRSV